MFERMEIYESVYEGVLEPPYLKPTWADSNHAYHSSQKRVEAASSCTCPKEGEIVGKRRK